MKGNGMLDYANTIAFWTIWSSDLQMISFCFASSYCIELIVFRMAFVTLSSFLDAGGSPSSHAHLAILDGLVDGFLGLAANVYARRPCHPRPYVLASLTYSLRRVLRQFRHRPAEWRIRCDVGLPPDLSRRRAFSTALACEGVKWCDGKCARLWDTTMGGHMLVRGVGAP